jgi:hypothetical protein
MDPATLIEMAQTWLRLAQEEDPSLGGGEIPLRGNIHLSGEQIGKPGHPAAIGHVN